MSHSGVGELPPVVQPELVRTGKLVEVMPEWRFRTFDLSLVHLGNRHISKPCRLFKEFAAQMAPTLFPDLSNLNDAVVAGVALVAGGAISNPGKSCTIAS